MINFAISIVFLWLIVLSWIVIKTRQHYINLYSKTKKYKLDEILEQLLNNEKSLISNLDSLKKEVKLLEENSKMHVQKIGLVRFNPFDRSGGEQSFVLALLNQKKSGIVMNFIYTKDGLRIYTKKIKEGEGEKYELSDEEREAIKKSL